MAPWSTMPKEVEGRAGKTADPRHRHHVGQSKGGYQAEQLPPVGLRASAAVYAQLPQQHRPKLRRDQD